jgi:O-antigen ligase
LVSSAIYAEVPIRSFIVTGLLALGAITYFATFVGVFNRQRLIWAGRVLLVAAMLNALVAALAALAHYTLGTRWGVSTSGVGAPATGLAHEYNILGGMAASAAIAFLVLMRERNPLFSRRFCVLSFWICFAALVASLTRGAWIAFIVALLAMLMIRRKVRPRRNRVAQIAITAMGLAVGLGAIYVVAAAPSDPSTPNAIVARGSRLLEFGEGSGANRVSEWQIALREVQRSPLLGLGTNSYGQRHEAPKKRPENAKGAFIGNLYIRTLYDSGIVGLSFLLVFLLSVEWPKRFLQRSAGDLAIVARTFIFMYFTLGAAYVVTDASFQVWPWIVLGLARASRSHAFRQYLSLRMTPVGNGAAGNGAGGNGRRQLVGAAVPLSDRGPATISIRRDDR